MASLRAPPLVQIVRLLLAGNSLSGPAFPPSWLAPGALPGLAQLELSGNAQLTARCRPVSPGPSSPPCKAQARWGRQRHCRPHGEAQLDPPARLPACLPAPPPPCSTLDGTAVADSVPEAWCHAVFGQHLTTL